MAIDSPELPSSATEKTTRRIKPVLVLDDITHQHPTSENAILEKVRLDIGEGQCVAIVGPSGCGKSTLLKVIAGVLDPEEGRILWHGNDLLHEIDLDPQDLGYVPQFSIAHDRLDVDECVENALRLRVGGLDRAELADKVDQILADTGLAEIADRQVAVLSGGQKRRLGLAMELASRPALLLCDEVTSGLDPKSEDEIVDLLRTLSRENNRIVLSVTHSLRRLSSYDSVVVLCDGRVAYHGPARYLMHYFDVTQPEDVFTKLSLRNGERWARSWEKHRPAYYSQMFAAEDSKASAEETLGLESATGEAEDEKDSKEKSKENKIRKEKKKDDDADEKSAPAEEKESDRHCPGFLSQTLTLTTRRFTLFFREPSQVWLQIGMLIGFPILVALFALNGLPQIKNLSVGLDVDWFRQMKESVEFAAQSAKVGTLVSGLVMFQVILLTLMASNNSAREIAGERLIFEKERLAGLRASAYLSSKLIFLGILVVVQSCWMGLFIHAVCKFPGDLGMQLVFLTLVNGAMTAICLGISSLAKTAEQASLMSIYLVGFQLPLSGAVLALPEPLGAIVRPFVSSYWSWSGYLKTMRETRYYEVVQDVAQTVLSAAPLCLMILVFHLFAGIFLGVYGIGKNRWNDS